MGDPNGLFGSYKFKIFVIVIITSLVPVVGMFILASVHVATVDQAVEMTHWALGASTLGGLFVIAGRAFEDASAKGVGKTINAAGNVEVHNTTPPPKDPDATPIIQNIPTGKS